MTLVADYAVAVVFALIILVVQVVMITTTGPQTELYQLAASAEQLNGPERAEFYHKISTLWGPLIGYFVCATFPLIRAYRRQAATAPVSP